MRKQAAGPSQRQLRVAEEIRHVLAGVFARHELRDPDLADAQVTVTEVRIGPDLKHAIGQLAPWRNTVGMAHFHPQCQTQSIDITNFRMLFTQLP